MQGYCYNGTCMDYRKLKSCHGKPIHWMCEVCGRINENPFKGDSLVIKYHPEIAKPHINRDSQS